MDISENGLRLIEGFEGYGYRAYWDPYGHVWTVGYGETEGVNPGTTMTHSQAQADLHRRLTREYEPYINRLDVPLNQNQYDALCSFVWNLGPGILGGYMGQLLRARRFNEFADRMLAYDHAGGVILQGLRTRRQAERALFLTPPPAYWPDDELRWIREYDRLKARNRNRPRRVVLRHYMARRAGQILDRVRYGQGGWEILNRRARYQALHSRSS